MNNFLIVARAQPSPCHYLYTGPREGSAVFLLMAVYAEVEDFPGGVEKPLEARLLDFSSRLAELVTDAAHGYVATGQGWVVQLLSGVHRSRYSDRQGVSYRKDYAVSSSRDGIGPSVAQEIKWVFAMMAQPWNAISRCGQGEPSEGFQNV